MEKLIELLASIIEESSKNENNYKYYKFILYWFWLLTLSMLILSYFKTWWLFEKIWEASFYIFSFFVFLFILSKWAKNYEDKKNIDMEDIVNTLKKLQSNFSDKKFLTPTRITRKFRNWKDIFKINDNNDITIVSVIDEEESKIQNFYIWTKNEWYKKQIQEIIKKQDIIEVDEEEKQKWWYWKDHFVFEKPLELCKKWEYKEAIKILLEVLEKLDCISKKTD